MEARLSWAAEPEEERVLIEFMHFTRRDVPSVAWNLFHGVTLS